MTGAPTTSLPPAAERPLAATTFVLAAALAALSLFWMATEQHYSACVQAQVAKYPAIGVSAVALKSTGPIKLSYDTQRRAAVGQCKHFLFF